MAIGNVIRDHQVVLALHVWSQIWVSWWCQLVNIGGKGMQGKPTGLPLHPGEASPHHPGPVAMVKSRASTLLGQFDTSSWASRRGTPTTLHHEHSHSKQASNQLDPHHVIFLPGCSAAGGKQSLGFD